VATGPTLSRRATCHIPGLARGHFVALSMDKLTSDGREWPPILVGRGWHGGCFGPGMRLNFKRLGLLCGKAARACARVGGLTSARVDLLSLLMQRQRVQVDLAALLCVSPPVVSKMLAALERLGLVERFRHPYDRRYKVCVLTDAGRQQVHVCLDEIGGDPADGTWSAQCVGEHRWTYDWWKPLVRIGLELRSVVEQPALPFHWFARIQDWNRAVSYDGTFGGRCEHPDPLP